MRLLILLLCFTFACTDSPTTPDGSLSGTWEGKNFFTVRYDNGSVFVDRDGRDGLLLKTATVTVKGKNVEMVIANPFRISAADVLYFKGEIEGDRIPGTTWTNYNQERRSFIFVRVK